jgi:putative hydrolase
MKLWADFHTHTRYSHGTGTIKENVEAALKKGLSAVGISEHGPANIGIGTRLEDFARMREEIEKIKSEYTDIKILLGCEANVISQDGELDIPEKILNELDYIMAGLHPLVWPSSLRDGYGLLIENMMARHSGILKGKVLERNTTALIKAIKSYKIDVITHPGLHLAIDTARLAGAAAKFGTALEINAGHGFMTEEYVRTARAYGVKFAIGSDAHQPRDVGNLRRGIEIAERVGLTEKDIINATPVVEFARPYGGAD